MVQVDFFTIFFLVASVSLVILTILATAVLFRLVRILGRVDDLTKDIGGVLHFFRELRENAVASSLALLIKKLISEGENKSKRSKAK